MTTKSLSFTVLGFLNIKKVPLTVFDGIKREIGIFEVQSVLLNKRSVVTSQIILHSCRPLKIRGALKLKKTI